LTKLQLLGAIVIWPLGLNSSLALPNLFTTSGSKIVAPTCVVRVVFGQNLGGSPSQLARKHKKAGFAWPMFHHDREHTGLSKIDTRSDLGNMTWKFPVDLNGKSPGPIQPLSSPALGRDDTIYVGSPMGVSAVNRHGILKWTFRTNASGESSSPAIGSDDTVYFGSMDGSLYAIDSNGRLEWKFSTHGVASSPTVGEDGTIYFGSFDGKLYALNPDGSRKWEFKTDDKVPVIPALASDGTIYFSGGALTPDGALKWRFPASIVRLPRFSPPAVASDGTIYFGGSDGELHALNHHGALKWNFPVERGYVFTTPAIDRHGTLYFGVNGGVYFYALRPDGALKWKFKTEGNVLSSAAVGGDGVIYFGSEDGYFYALSPTGRLKWKFPAREPHGNRSAGHDPRKVNGARASRVHDKNLSYLHHISAASSASSPAIGTDGTIYFVSLDGHLYALH
jgi:outer membrane protein assembly factor BamB